LTIGLPVLLPIFGAIVPHRPSVNARSHFRALRKDVWLAASLTAFLITFLAHQAWLMIDAIGRTLFRREPAEPAAVGHRSSGEPHTPA
jgi:cyclic beta-1,2-glucan synthetase